MRRKFSQPTTFAVNNRNCPHGDVGEDFISAGKYRVQPHLADNALAVYNEDQRTFPLTDFGSLPAEWKQTPDGVTSYVMPIPEGGKNYGGYDLCMWFDLFQGEGNQDVAILPSAEGINPLDLVPTKSSMGLRQYEKKCPSCQGALQGRRWCRDCKRKTPPKNYFSGRSRQDATMYGYNGVNLMTLTRDPSQSVAKEVLGAKNREPVPSFGFLFYEANAESAASKPKQYDFSRDAIKRHWDGVADLQLPAWNFSFQRGGKYETLYDRLEEDVNAPESYAAHPAEVAIVYFVPDSYLSSVLMPHYKG